MEKIYIILSRSNTLFAKAIRKFTKKYYNHTSIAFDIPLTTFYSFGRRYPRFSFPAGFIQEGVTKGFFNLHPKTQIAVLEMCVTSEEIEIVQKKLQPFLDNPKRFQYNIKKIPLMMLGIPTQCKRKYVCSVFVAYLLKDILDYKKDYSLVYPEDFLNFNFKKIYEGTAEDYEY